MFYNYGYIQYPIRYFEMVNRDWKMLGLFPEYTK